ncbi:MAG: DUF4832 domain-containing protein [bacterium]|nr:DUF4832 domain-containing protein [bacterium]
MKSVSCLAGLAMAFGSLSCFSHRVSGQDASEKTVVVHPREYEHGLRNPLMGLRPGLNIAAENAYGTLGEWRVAWNLLESSEGDEADKIQQYCDREWSKYYPEEQDIKIIPRVMTYSPGFKENSIHENYRPADLTENDWSSDQFRQRMVRLAYRLAEVWDNDPRVAFVEMGILGNWGEQLGEDVGSTPQNRKLLGEAFSRAFKNKKVMVRVPWDWGDLVFGSYWDSFAHADLLSNYYPKYAQYINSRGLWKTQVFGGECAYDWGNYKIQPGLDPTTTLADPLHRNLLIDCIRTLHTTYLGWVSNYYPGNAQARQGADEVQRVLGYRFVLKEVRYPSQISKERPFEISFDVRNEGSAPFYYPWPVEVSLLKPDSREVVWKAIFEEVDIRQWLPGDDWNSARNAYTIKPESYAVKGVFSLPQNLDPGEYVLALAILDPAGMLPCVRFATVNYFKGGRHPIGLIGVEREVVNPLLDDSAFDDPNADRTLHYGS